MAKTTKKTESPAEENQAIAVRPNNVLSANSGEHLPEFMREDLDDNMASDLQRHIVPPRLTLRQPTSGEPLDVYSEGTPAVMPLNLALGTYRPEEDCLEQPLIVVPIFMFTEYTLDNPYKYRKELGSVRDRSFDHNGSLALKAQNPQTREFPCPEHPDEMCRYMTRLNFLLWVLQDDAPGEPVVVTFKSTEQSVGQQFSSLILARRGPVYGQQFFLDVKKRKNDHGKWYGFEVRQPTTDVGAFVADAEMYKVFKEAHTRMKEAFAARTLTPDDEEYIDPEKSGSYDTGDEQTIDAEAVNETRF